MQNAQKNQQNTVIGENILITGNLSGDEDLTILGRFEGTISLANTLEVAEGGIVKAEVAVENAVISGVLVGNITASQSIHVTETGRLVGDMQAPRVIIVAGARVRGQVEMGEQEELSETLQEQQTTQLVRPAPLRLGLPARRQPQQASHVLRNNVGAQHPRSQQTSSSSHSVGTGYAAARPGGGSSQHSVPNQARTITTQIPPRPLASHKVARPAQDKATSHGAAASSASFHAALVATLSDDTAEATPALTDEVTQASQSAASTQQELNHVTANNERRHNQQHVSGKKRAGNRRRD